MKSRIAEQTPLVIIQVRKESKLRIHPNAMPRCHGCHVSHLLIHLKNTLTNVLYGFQ